MKQPINMPDSIPYTANVPTPLGIIRIAADTEEALHASIKAIHEALGDPT